MKFLFCFYSLFIIFFCSTCSLQKPKEAKAIQASLNEAFVLSPAQYKNTGIVLGKITQMKLAILLKVSGKIDVPPQSLFAISFPMGGYLKQTRLLPGMSIKKGEILALMEDPQYIQLQQDYLIARNKLGLMAKEYERQKFLFENKANSEKIFQLAESDFLTQKIILKALGERLKLIFIQPDTLEENNISKTIKIPAPINGFVSKVNVNIGKYISPTDVMFELIDPNDIHLNLQVFEKDVKHLAIRQTLNAYTNADSDKKHLCKIILINRSVNADGIIDVHCHFENYEQGLFPGMFMMASIESKNKIANVLPDDAVVRFENKNYVFIEGSNKTIEMQEVEIGIMQNGFTEILINPSLLSANIVLKGAYTLLMKMKNEAE